MAEMEVLDQGVARAASSARRVASVDVLRGIIMVVMALDHVRDFFSNAQVNPTDPVNSWPMLFATRWITHLCAPGFVALAGASVYLQKQRGRSAGDAAKKLVSRGLWLIFVELAIVSPGIFFTYHFHFMQVIYAIGGSMIVLAALQYLPVRFVAVYGVAVVLLHNALDGVKVAPVNAGGVLWHLLVTTGFFMRHGELWAACLYPILPWSGVMALGYAFGSVVAKPAAERQRSSLVLGCVALALFAVLRVGGWYGDPIVFKALPGVSHTVMAFLNVTKYPPSLQYCCVTMGVLLLLFVAIDKMVESRAAKRVTDVFEVYGRVPFFYYVPHFYLIHLIALGTYMVKADTFSKPPGLPLLGSAPALAAYGLPVVYAIWIFVVVVLYLPCKWFAGVKARRRDWWLSYL